MLVYQ